MIYTGKILILKDTKYTCINCFESGTTEEWNNATNNEYENNTSE